MADAVQDLHVHYHGIFESVPAIHPGLAVRRAPMDFELLLNS